MENNKKKWWVWVSVYLCISLILFIIFSFFSNLTCFIENFFICVQFAECVLVAECALVAECWFLERSGEICGLDH